MIAAAQVLRAPMETSLIVRRPPLRDAHKAAKLRKASTHWLRHTAPSRTRLTPVSSRYVNRSARHAKLETTAIYLHAEDDAWREAMEKHKLVKAHSEKKKPEA
jgi:site-specific recombinase XerD